MKINKIFVNGNIININSNGEKVSKSEHNKIKPIIEKTLDATNIRDIIMNSLDANVYFSSEDISEIIVRAYGSNLDISLSYFTYHLARIVVRNRYNTGINRYNIVTEDSLKIEVIIPNKLFNLIAIQTRNGNITVDSSIACRSLELTSTNGDVTTKPPFECANIKSINGNVTMQICATSNSEVHIQNTNGNIDITLSNFWKNNIRVSSLNGFSRNIYYPSGKYDICGSISSTNGNIYIK